MYNTIMQTVGRPDPTVFLIGANRGHDIQYLWNMFPRMKLWAFEPSPLPFSELAQAWGNDKRIKLYNLAVSNENGTGLLYINFSQMTNSLLEANTQSVDYVPEQLKEMDRVPVSCVRLDSFCAKHGIGQIDLLYSDAQGCESMILEGAGDMLHNGKIKVMFLEMMNTDIYKNVVMANELSELIAACGYRRVAEFSKAIKKDGRCIHSDVLWSPA